MYNRGDKEIEDMESCCPFPPLCVTQLPASSPRSPGVFIMAYTASDLTFIGEVEAAWTAGKKPALTTLFTSASADNLAALRDLFAESTGIAEEPSSVSVFSPTKLSPLLSVPFLKDDL